VRGRRAARPQDARTKADPSGPAVSVDNDKVSPRPQRRAPALRAGWPPTAGWSAMWSLVGFALLYAAAAWLGRMSRVDGTPLALVWPAAASGYLWLTWSAGRRRLRRDAVVLSLIAGAVNWATGTSVSLAAVFAAANAAQAVLAVVVVRRLTGDWRLRTGRQLGALIAGSIAGAAVGALVGTAGMAVLLGVDMPTTCAAWVVRNASNTFVFAAVAVRLADLGWQSLRSGRRPSEWAATIAVITAVYVLIFGELEPVPLSAFALPLSMWVALRFSTTAAAAHVLLAGFFVVTATVVGRGPYQDQPTVLRVVLAQAFVATVGLIALVLALHRDERDRLLGELAAERDQHAAQSALLEVVLDTVDVAVVACDASGHLTLFNRAAREFHGTDADPSVETSGWADRFDLYEADGTTPLAAGRVPLAVALRDGQVDEQFIVIAPHGLPSRTVRVAGRQMTDQAGRVLGAVVAQSDVTGLRASEREFRQAFLSGPTPSARLSVGGTVEQVNPALRRMLALPSKALVGRALVDLTLPEDRDALGELLRGRTSGPVEVRFQRADGRPLWCEVSATLLAASGAVARTGSRAAPRLLVQVLDVHDRRTREEHLLLAAQRDPLTGLANRVVADARLAVLADQPAEHETVLAYIDLDGFKAVNDDHGHEAGDAVLKAAAERLRTVVRPGDAVVRLGGDEFLLICPVLASDWPDGTGSGGAEPLATALLERIEDLFGEPVVHAGTSLRVGASVGTVVARGGQEAADLLTQADQAMYERKRDRRSRPGATPVHGPQAEQKRLQTLRGLDILDTAPDPVLDELVRLAALVAGVPTALVSLVDEHRQWFKARCGLAVGETSREVSFCARVVDTDRELHVHDARRDPRFADNALVTGEPHIRSYAGFPLRHSTGHVLGSLCVIGYRPSSLDDAQRRILRLLAAEVNARLASDSGLAGPALPAAGDGRHDDLVRA